MSFSLENSCCDTKARTGVLKTHHGAIKTPIFMPVGTQGTVKAIYQHQLEEDIKAQIILGNTYHLYLRPGTQLLQEIGGLHHFMNWEKPILTDSGGYQVYSLSGIRKINEEGVEFQSHIDGSKHFFTPELVIEIQRQIGADIIMAFDECTPYPCEFIYAQNSLKLTHRWLKRCFDQYQKSIGLYGYEQILAPIVQGSVFKELRVESAQFVTDFEAEVYAIGGLSVGEPIDDMYEITDVVTDILPKDKARYLMGVGTPANLLESIALGIDMFDCVMPTRNARHGLLFTLDGIINIKNAKWKNDFTAIDAEIHCPTSNQHSKAYLRHLFLTNELLGMQIASLHNLTFYLEIVRLARQKIEEGSFFNWKEQIVNKVARKL